MKILYHQGNINAQTFEQVCRREGLEPQQVVFLFPGNSGHHGKHSTLFSIKSGAGLAQASSSIGNKGYPTLSLPTTSMEQWDRNKTQQSTVEGAIADVYRALGAGYSLLLPIREHRSATYFSEGLAYSDGLSEPSFWGGVQTASNKPLADHYIKTLNNLHDFIALNDEQRFKLVQSDSNNPYFKAYLEGAAMSADDPWLAHSKPHSKPSVEIRRLLTKPVTNPRLTMPTRHIEDTQPQKLQVHPHESLKGPLLHQHNSFTFFKSATQAPSSYERLYRSEHNPLASAKALLNDYTKNNSWFWRILTGHWNRHHVKEVAAIVHKIDSGEISDSQALIDRLHDVHLVNPNGSLARRIRFIEEQWSKETTHHDTLRVSLH